MNAHDAATLITAITNMVDKTPVAEFYFDRKDREFFSLTIDPSRQ